jgi:hypothetical protein
MNHILPILHANGMNGGDAKPRRSDRMLAELLDLNEEMITQLRLERLSTVGTTDFIAGMIDQHEEAATRLRAQLARHKNGASHRPGAVPVTFPISHS